VADTKTVPYRLEHKVTVINCFPFNPSALVSYRSLATMDARLRRVNKEIAGLFSSSLSREWF
jgi:hypothetical protein